MANGGLRAGPGVKRCPVTAPTALLQFGCLVMCIIAEMFLICGDLCRCTSNVVQMFHIVIIKMGTKLLAPLELLFNQNTGDQSYPMVYVNFK